MISDDERQHLAALRSGKMPLQVYADWLEEQGDELSEGVRWCAELALDDDICRDSGSGLGPVESFWLQLFDTHRSATTGEVD